MSSNTPTPQEPAKETVKSLTPPPVQRTSFWAMTIAVVTGLPTLVDMLFTTPGLDIPDGARPWLLLASVIATWVAAMQNGDRGVKAAARSHEQLEAQIDAKTLR